MKCIETYTLSMLPLRIQKGIIKTGKKYNKSEEESFIYFLKSILIFNQKMKKVMNNGIEYKIFQNLTFLREKIINNTIKVFDAI